MEQPPWCVLVEVPRPCLGPPGPRVLCRPPPCRLCPRTDPVLGQDGAFQMLLLARGGSRLFIRSCRPLTVRIIFPLSRHQSAGVSRILRPAPSSSVRSGSPGTHSPARKPPRSPAGSRRLRWPLTLAPNLDLTQGEAPLPETASQSAWALPARFINFVGSSGILLDGPTGRGHGWGNAPRRPPYP